MRRKFFGLFLLSAFITSSIFSQDTKLPTPILPELVDTHPFSYNGLVYAEESPGLGFTGSGSMVSNGVFVTAAHVVLLEDYDNKANSRWVIPPLSGVKSDRFLYFPRHNNGYDNFTGPNYQPVAIFGWTSYSGDSYYSRVLLDDNGPGESDPHTFNMDFAAAVFSEATVVDSITDFAEVNIDKDGELTVMRETRDKMVVGYPRSTDPDEVPLENRGLMHVTQPDDYQALYNTILNFDNEGYDFEGMWDGVWEIEGVTTYGGNSGGPVYVKDDLDNWIMSGIVVGGGLGGSDRMLMRTIDDNTWQWIEDAIRYHDNVQPGQQDKFMRVTTFGVKSLSSEAVILEWTDSCSEEAGYILHKQVNGISEKLIELPANETEYTDLLVDWGQTITYKIHPVDARGNLAPKSEPVVVKIPGSLEIAKNYLNAENLHLSTEGDSSWYIDDNTRLRAGKVHSMKHSSLILDIIGPGTVTFDWSVSSEENPNYDGTLSAAENPDDHPEGSVYDAMWLYMDGSPVTISDEPIFLSGPPSGDPTGLLSETDVQLVVPVGTHTIEWRYEKDPLTSEHQDTGFLDTLIWTPAANGAYPVYGAYEVEGSSLHASPWFGTYDAQHFPWAYHESLEWIYLIGGTPDHGTWLYMDDPKLGVMYTSPSTWPFLYRYKDNSGSWLYFFERVSNLRNRLFFYDFSTDEVIEPGL